jgi:hypothetical protein
VIELGDKRYFSHDELVRGGIYTLRSRNLLVGVFNGDQGFIGIREKFGHQYLFTEYLARECDGTQIGVDTAFPKECLGLTPDDIKITENAGLKCVSCGAYVTTDVRPADCGDCDNSDIRWEMNQTLFDLLKPLDDVELEKRRLEYKGDG